MSIAYGDRIDLQILSRHVFTPLHTLSKRAPRLHGLARVQALQYAPFDSEKVTVVVAWTAQLTESVTPPGTRRFSQRAERPMLRGIRKTAQALHQHQAEADSVKRRRSSAGFAIIDLLFVCGIISILSGIALPRLMMAKGSAEAASAMGSLRVIGSGQVAFAITCANGFYAPSLTKLAQPPPGTTDGFIRGDLGAADVQVKSGYQFQVFSTPYALAPGTCNAVAAGTTGLAFKAGADPLDANNPRYFAANAGNVIWEDSASLWAGMPESGDSPTGHPIKF
jgi:competence protein ComGC